MTTSLFGLLGRYSTEALAFCRAVVLCAIAFGLGWTGDQVAAFMLVLELGLALIQKMTTTSNQTVRDAGLTPAGVKGRAAENLAGTGDGSVRPAPPFRD